MMANTWQCSKTSHNVSYFRAGVTGRHERAARTRGKAKKIITIKMTPKWETSEVEDGKNQNSSVLLVKM